MQILPFTPSEANYQFSTTLAGVDYVFRVRWQGREAAWYFDILDSEEQLIRGGIKIVLGVALGIRCARADFPRGVFLAVDTSGASVDATFDDLGVRVLVYFYTPAEILALYE